MKSNLGAAIIAWLPLLLVTGFASADARKPNPRVLSFNNGAGVLENRFEAYEVSLEDVPTKFIIDRKTGCEFMLSTRGGIQPTTPLDQCPKENIKPIPDPSE